MKRKESGLKKPDLLSTMKAKLDDVGYLEFPVEFPLASDCIIYRVPPRLRKVNEDAYTPSLVSIGPFHHGDQRLESMEGVKLWFLKKFLKRNPGKSLEDYVDEVGKKEDEIRRCYAEIIPMESDDFVSMVITDACFIIEYFLTSQGPEENPWNLKIWPNSDIALDLILLENQLPFFVLEKIFNLALPDYSQSFLEVTYRSNRMFLSDIVPEEEIGTRYDNFNYFEQYHLINNDIQQVQHLCDMLRIFYLRCDPPPRTKQCCKMCAKLRSFCFTNSQAAGQGCKKLCGKLRSFFFPCDPQGRREHLPQKKEQGCKKLCDKLRDLRSRCCPKQRKHLKLTYCASKLHEAGVKFQVDEGNKFMDVHYSKGVLRMPSICVVDETETIIRNVIAFEQCHIPLRSIALTNYICFLDDLIDSGKDVEILVEKGIIHNFMGDNNAVASMVNNLCINIYYDNLSSSDDDGLCKTFEDLNKFYENPCHKHKAIFKRQYLSTPWKMASFIAAILLLLLTFIQTICSAIPFM